jgi:hypothetical protein
LVAVLTAVGCVAPIEHNLPPAERLFHPGPGVDGPGPGVMGPVVPGMHGMPGGPEGVMMDPAMSGCMGEPFVVGSQGTSNVQVLFAKPEGMQVRWDITMQGAFDSVPLVVPGRQNFPQAAIYRLKLTNIPGREGVELYPTVEIGPTTPRSEAYLAHNAIPIQFTEEDFDQVLTGNFVTKVIYLPDPEFQELALAGVETLVSTRLDPGIDPITEADRRGAILAVVRLGNKDVELPGANGDATPAIPMARNGSGVAAASYDQNITAMPPGCMPGAAYPMDGGMIPGAAYPVDGTVGQMPGYVAGVTAPEWGMPYTGTTIGLPGPPHVPLGGPAGLRNYTMTNRTRVHIPPPTKHMNVVVRQRPGFSYPAPPNRLHVTEQMVHPSLPFDQPRIQRHECVY